MLDLRPFMSGSQQDKPHKYALYAVLVHAGHSNNSGHYYSYIKAPNGRWHCMDDETVSTCKLSTVLKQKAGDSSTTPRTHVQ